MNKKNRDALKGLVETLIIHEAETTYGAVEVDVDELKTLLRWAQDEAHHYFKGDRVTWTGARVPDAPWLYMGMEGTVISESDETQVCRVEWDGGPQDDGENRIVMYHNEIRLA